jgi:Transposase and inactivated derivatives
MGFSRRMPKGEGITESRVSYGERSVWQRRYWEHFIRDDEDFRKYVDYIHFNPVKHGYVTHPVDWPYSSVHRCIRDGVLPSNWGAGRDANDDGQFGER